MQILFIILAVMALLVWWSRRRRRAQRAANRPAKISPAHGAMQPEPAAPAVTDVAFRAQGARAVDGAVYGDVLCSDGVYLPQVWESDFHTSFDGRWIRTGSYGGSVPCLVDRKSRRSWRMDVQEAAVLDHMHWRLPRWDTHAGKLASNGMAAANSPRIWTDASFEDWLQQNIAAQAQPLVGVCDLWIPAEELPKQAQAEPPVLPQPDNAAVQLGVQRYLPPSLRVLEQPMQPLRVPEWQLLLNGEPQLWRMLTQSHVVWRGDGQAFACYGAAPNDVPVLQEPRLAMWSVVHGRQQWSQWMPVERKPWQVRLPALDTADATPLLQWEGALLLQTVEMDNPVLERAHNGRTLGAGGDVVLARSGQHADGRLEVAPLPPRRFQWRRDMDVPTQWEAQSEPVAGQSLVWHCVQDAADEDGATAAYRVQWGAQTLPGLWQLEHVVVQQQWAILLPHEASVLQGGQGVPQSWDGVQLKAMRGASGVLRLRPHSRAARVQLLVLAGCGPDASQHAHTGMWRWPLQLPTVENLRKPNWSPVYEWRDAAVNPEGQWQVLPRWRKVQQIQHTAADGDYVWRKESDSVWWWGGLAQSSADVWAPQAPRGDGVVVTQSGAVLCGMSPNICPHYAGDGWLVLEGATSTAATQHPSAWRLHWLRPGKQEVRTVELRAVLPVLQRWDAQQGVHWLETGLSQSDRSDAPAHELQVLPGHCWYDADREALKQSTVGLWVRKQDAVYAEGIAARDDWPWPKPSKDVAAP